MHLLFRNDDRGRYEWGQPGNILAKFLTQMFEIEEMLVSEQLKILTLFL
jgi:hypothetical protein